MHKTVRSLSEDWETHFYYAAAARFWGMKKTCHHLL